MPASGKKIAITVGDPAGVGPDVIAAWAKSAPERLLARAEVLAHADFLETLPEELGKRPVGAAGFRAKAGEPSSAGCEVAALALEGAAAGCADGRYSAVVTAPISKFEMRKIGFDFPGQTEFFAARWGGEPVMCFAGVELLVSLATWHEPLSKVPSLLDFGRISRAVESAAELARRLRGAGSPRIAVCGLNPHAGEDGLMGREEIDVIDPILDGLREKYPNLSRTLPPDTIFARMRRGEFDAVAAMYHDQALAPLKTLEFDRAVNISMNLPHLRTSPDHGTGYSIAGTGAADCSSFSNAVDLALKLCR